MAISQKLQDAINDQIQWELKSSYTYLAMAAYFEAQNLKGMARWMRVQAEEETGHAMKFFDFVSARGGRVYLKAIEQPVSDYGSPLEVFQEALAHEQEVTGRINNMYFLARDERDPATETLLHWFVNEQVEEEQTATEVIETLKRIGPSQSSLVMIDRHLGKRGGA